MLCWSIYTISVWPRCTTTTCRVWWADPRPGSGGGAGPASGCTPTLSGTQQQLYSSFYKAELGACVIFLRHLCTAKILQHESKLSGTIATTGYSSYYVAKLGIASNILRQSRTAKILKLGFYRWYGTVPYLILVKVQEHSYVVKGRAGHRRKFCCASRAQIKMLAHKHKCLSISVGAAL